MNEIWGPLDPSLVRHWVQSIWKANSMGKKDWKNSLALYLLFQIILVHFLVLIDKRVKIELLNFLMLELGKFSNFFSSLKISKKKKIKKKEKNGK